MDWFESLKERVQTDYSSALCEGKCFEGGYFLVSFPTHPKVSVFEELGTRLKSQFFLQIAPSKSPFKSL